MVIYMKWQRILCALWMVVLCLLIGVLGKYYQESSEQTTTETERKELIVMATYEAEPYRRILKELVEVYSDNPENPLVKIRFVAQADFQKELCIDKDKGKLPDLIISENVTVPAIVSMGILRDLTEYMDVKKSSQFIRAAYDSTLVDGKCYGVPFTCDPYVLFYNKDYWEKRDAELSADLPETFEVMKANKTLGTYNFGMSIKNKEDVAACFLQMIYSCGGTIRNLNGSQCMELYEIYEEMKNSNMISPDIINWNQSDLMEHFADGMVTMAAAKLSSLSILDSKDVDFEYRIMEIPYAQKQVYLMHGENIGVTVDADYEETIKFLEYLVKKETLEIYSKKTFCLSVRKDLSNNPAPEKGITDEFIERQRKQSVLKSSYSSWFAISGAIAENLTEFFGDTTIGAEKVAEELQEEVRTAILER